MIPKAIPFRIKWFPGGAIAGTSHFVGTAKRLEEEGVSRSQRMQALPTAVRCYSALFLTCPSSGIQRQYMLNFDDTYEKA